MAQPPVYNRQFNFSNWQTLFPSSPPPGSDIDAELSAIKTTLDAMIADFALLQNNDGTVLNQSIGPAQLSSQLTAGFTAPSAWVTATAYTASPASTVLQGTAMYICLVSHTSGTFATDLAANKWLKIFDLSTLTFGTASQITVTGNGNNVATNVQTSLTNLDSNKAATSHTHTASQISDSTSAGRTLLTAANLAAQQTALGLGSLAYLNSVSITAVAGQLAFTGKIGTGSGFSLTTNTNDWAPTGYATNAVIEVSSTSAINITGLSATSDGDIKFLDNVGSYTITLTAQDANSASANRFLFTRPVGLKPGQVVTLKYDGANTGWRLTSPIATSPTMGTYKNLVIGNGAAARYANYTQPGTPNTQFVVTYDELVLEDANGERWVSMNGNWTISTATTGAVNGLDSAFSLTSAKIFVWVIGNPVTNTVGALMSVSSTAPTLPSGYTFKARVGATFTNGSSNLVRTVQVGRRAWYVPDGTQVYPTLASGTTSSTYNTTTFTPASVSTAAVVPTTAASIGLLITTTSGSAVVAIAPSTNFTGYNGASPPPLNASLASGAYPVAGEIQLEATTVQWYSSNATVVVLTRYWDDNL